MVLCPPQIQPSSALSDAPVTDFSVRNFLGSNQQTYQQLKTILSLDLRRQILIAVCDDLPLRDRLAHQLQIELAHIKSSGGWERPTGWIRQPTEPRAIPRLVTLELDLYDPNPIAQVAAWLHDLPTLHLSHSSPLPAFQILGIEQLTRQSAETQNTFLSYLATIEQMLPVLECNLILWMTQPWFRMIPEAVPEFWRYHTGIFQFAGDPMPLPVTHPERIQSDRPTPTLRQPVRDSGQTGMANPTQSPSAPSDQANPWLPLADDLSHWFEEPDSQFRQDSPQSQWIGSDSTALSPDPQRNGASSEASSKASSQTSSEASSD